MRTASFQILFKCHTPAIGFGNATKPSRSAHFWQGAESLAPATQKHILTSKNAPRPPIFTLLTSTCASHNGVHFFDISTSKSGPTLRCFVHFDFDMTSTCASRHNDVHFFKISTSKSAPKLSCFVHFDFEMCFAPQRCAIFHLSSGQMAPHP